MLWGMYFLGLETFEKAFCKLERTRLWAARCEYISTWTCELHQHLYDWWYVVGHG